MDYSLTDTPETKGYSLYEEDNKSASPTGTVARNRARRYDIALGTDSPGVDTLDGFIQAGQESYVQDTGVSSERNRLKEERVKQIKQAVQTAQTPEQARAAAQRYMQPVTIDPNTVLESSFADRYIQMVMGMTSDSEVTRNAVKDDPEGTKQTVSGNNFVIGMREVARKIKEDQEAEVAKQGWGESIWNTLETVVPMASSIRMSPDWNPANIALTGSSLAAEREKFWSFQNLPDAQKWLKGRVAQIAQSNPYDALHFANAMIELPSDSIMAGNVFGVADVEGVGTPLVLAGKAALSAAAFRRLMKSSRDGIGVDGAVKMEDVQAATGDIAAAARTKVQKDIIENKDPLALKDSIKEIVPNFYNPTPSMVVEPGSMARERAQRIAGVRDIQNESIRDAWTRTARAQRTPEEAIPAMVRENEELVKQQFPSVQDALIDSRVFLDPDTNVRYSEHIFGKNDGTLFKTEKQSLYYAIRYYGLSEDNFRVGVLPGTEKNAPEGLKTASRGVLKEVKPGVDKKELFKYYTEQQGAYHYIVITKPLNETSDAARSMITTTSNTNPVTFGNWFLGGLMRSADDQVAYFQRGNRNIATHAPQEMQRVLVDIARNIGVLKKESHEALERVLTVNKDYMDYSKPPGQQRGRAFKTQQELEKNWIDINNGKLPTEQESLAYWTYHDLMDADWIMRNYGVVRDLVRQGMEQYSVKVPGLQGDIVTTFPGRFEKDLPWASTNDFSVHIVNGDERKVYWRSKMSPEDKEMIEALQKDGYQVIQVGNPADRPFKDTYQMNSMVNFVLTKEHDVKPLPMKQVDYQPGVHVMYPQEHLVKQPIIETGEFGRLHHYGDRTIFAVDTEVEAIRLGKAITDLQTMRRNLATEAEQQAFIEKNLPEDFGYWERAFKNYISMDQPIGNTYSGKGFFDTRPELLTTEKYKGLRNERNTEWNLYRAVDMDFMQDRDAPLMTVTRNNTPEKPLYSLEKARTLDPFVSLNRALGNSIRNLYMNDYKLGAIEQWVRQYASMMSNPESALKNPFQTFYHPSWNEGVVDRATLASAKNTHERIVNFLGTRTELGRDLNHVQQKIMNSLGEQGARWYNDHELRALKNPVAFLRSWMFDFRFGFFNPKQYIVQAQGFTHIYGVAGPEAAWRGTSAYILQRALGMTEDEATINKIAGIAAKFGWKKEHFIESYRAMRDAGFDIVGKEHALIADVFDPKIFTTKVGNALEIGRTPFVEGERSVRIGAWNTAYYEWRKANPNKALNEFERAKVLTRADDLSLNMTRASASAIQEGLLSVPSQFYTFSHRILEQFWGGRLTPAEKARAFITHSALYGIPVAAGAAIPWPFYDEVRGRMLASGSELADSKVAKLFTDGFMDYATTMIMGGEYNPGTRYGPGFNDALKKVLEGEMPLIEGVMGASGSFLNAMWKATYPFRANVYLGLTGGQDQLPLVKEDIMQVLKEVSSINDFHNAFYAMATGKYFSKAGNFVAGEMTTKDAVAMIAGLTRKDITDARLIIGTLKDQTDAQNKMQSLAEREMKRAFQSAGDEDWGKFETYMIRAKAFMAIGDLTLTQKTQAYTRASTESQALVQRIQKQFIEKGYASQLPARIQRLFNGQ